VQTNPKTEKNHCTSSPFGYELTHMQADENQIRFHLTVLSYFTMNIMPRESVILTDMVTSFNLANKIPKLKETIFGHI